MLVCGVEEAGRGPIIGPLVMCGIVFDDSQERDLIKMGVKDSKLLSPRQREALFDKILEMSHSHEIIKIAPAEIDAAVQSKGETNLNWLEAQTSARMINKLRPDKVIVDCPSPNLKAYKARLGKMIDYPVEIIAEHKADVKYPIVSASSIIAKVTRDKEIDEIKNKIGIDFGSGYPADPITVAFIKKHIGDYPELFRKSWATYKTAIGLKKQKKLGEY